MRSALSVMLVVVVSTTACRGFPEGDATTSTVAATTSTAAPTSTTTTTTTTTTIATTTTLTQEEQDAVLVVQIWDEYTAAWEEGPEAASRYVVDHTYPGMPATFEDCLIPDVPAGYRSAAADPESITPDPGWEPEDVNVTVEGRTYVVDVLLRTGIGDDAEEETSPVHVTVRDGEAWFFISCEPQPPPTTTTTIPADALFYRLDIGADYTHRVTFRNEITEDQTGAGGSVRTGTETWTHDRSFEITGTTDDGTPRWAMTIDRVEWSMFSAGVTRNAFDSDVEEEQWWYGYHGDLVGDRTSLTMDPAGPSIDGETGQSFLALPVAPVVTGDTWESDWALGDPKLTGTMIVTVTDVDADTVRVAFEGVGSGTRVDSDPIEIDVFYDTDGTITGTAVIEAGTGWIASMTMDIEASGTIEVTSTGFWQEIRPLAGSAELNTGVPMPVTYVIHLETTTG